MPKLIATALTRSELEAMKAGGSPVLSPSSSGSFSLDVEAGTVGSGPTLTWRDVNFEVGSKKILDNVSGGVSGGTVCAILGPSGAGKSSLLNVLAGRSASRGATRVSAYVEVQGVEVDPVEFKRNVAYVMQDDALIPTATPREALRFSAALRTTANPEEREKLVTKMLAELNLTKCADVLIGGEMIKGISGGQRKRTSVGVELVTSPKLVFLDEPTSGLDSDAALSCIKLLKQVSTFFQFSGVIIYVFCGTGSDVVFSVRIT